MTGFYEVGPLGETAINLFHGFGYNFYRVENQLRADDQRFRSLACSLLGRARAAVELAESAWRRERLPPPTRANPFPDPQAIAGAQALERLSRSIGLTEGQLRHQPVPENDRMTQRFRQEAQALEELAGQDKILIGQAELLRVMIEGKSGDAVLADQADIAQGLEAIGETLRIRQLLLA